MQQRRRRRNFGGIVFCVVCIVSRQSLWICLCIRLDKYVITATNNCRKHLLRGLCRIKGESESFCVSGSINVLLSPLTIVGNVSFAVCAVSRVSLWVCLCIRLDKCVIAATNNCSKRLISGLCRIKGKKAISCSQNVLLFIYFLCADFSPRALQVKVECGPSLPDGFRPLLYYIHVILFIFMQKPP
jgi:hypothetical protein